jgi:hypothetical protein
VIAEYAAARLDRSPDDLEPRLLGHVALALALTAYEVWLDHPERDVTELLQQGLAALEALVAP